MKKSFVKQTINVVVFELVKILCGFRGCSFVSAMWVSNTDSMNDKLLAMKAPNGKGRALKANNPLYGRLSAIFCGNNLQFGIDYQNSVNNRLKKNGLEAEFEAEPLRWGHWYEYTENGKKETAFKKVIEHLGNFYIRLYKVKNTNIRATYYVDGVRVNYSDIKQYLKEENHISGKQLAAGLEDEEQSKPFTLQINNLRILGLNHKHYYVTM